MTTTPRRESRTYAIGWICDWCLVDDSLCYPSRVLYHRLSARSLWRRSACLCQCICSTTFYWAICRWQVITCVKSVYRWCGVGLRQCPAQPIVPHSSLTSVRKVRKYFTNVTFTFTVLSRILVGSQTLCFRIGCLRLSVSLPSRHRGAHALSHVMTQVK